MLDRVKALGCLVLSSHFSGMVYVPKQRLSIRLVSTGLVLGVVVLDDPAVDTEWLRSSS